MAERSRRREPSLRSRLRNPSLRSRITLSAVAVVGVALVVASTIFAVVQSAVLDQGVTSRATAAADRVLAQLEAGAPPSAAVEAARTALEQDGFVVVQAADSGEVLATGGDRGAVRAYEGRRTRTPGTSMRLGSTDYRVASSGATDRSTPAPTVTVAPPASDDPGGGRGGSDDSGSGGSGGGSDDSSSGSGSGSGTDGSGSGGGSDDQGSGSGSGSGGSDDSGSGSGSGSGGSGSDDSGGSGSDSGSSGGHGGDDAAAEPGARSVRLVAVEAPSAPGATRTWRTPGAITAASTASSASTTSTSTPAPGTDAASDYLVVAALSTESIEGTAAATRTTLLVAVPVLLLLMAATTWLVVGRALRPVERMRRQVAGITAAHLSERIPDPGGADEVARLAATLNDMLDRLDSSAAAQRRFVSDASHELRSPLAVMRQHAEVAKSYPDRVPQDRLADTVLHEGERLADLVTAMLVLAKTDEGALPVTAADVDLDDLVGSEVARLRTAGRLTVDASRVAPVRVAGDRGLLGQVLRNLVDNAARHASTSIAFELVEHRDGRAVLAVEDDGEGVADADRERVFERFVRLDEARARESGGSGLGLAIVRGIVQAHAGEVHVERAPSGGARFVVTLPAVHDDPLGPTDRTAASA